mmetsp:Transcript_15518/g.44928  ORF Transcript_15518/g.44928 Transcript_15518/m.44928 type:complete len:311 (-) Transcript_15518:243-1175(-)
MGRGLGGGTAQSPEDEEAGGADRAEGGLPSLLEGLVDHELDSDIWEHGNEGRSQTAVQSTDSAGAEHLLECPWDGGALLGVEGQHGLDDLEGVDDHGGDHAGDAAGEEAGTGVEGVLGHVHAEVAGDEHLLDELVHEELRAAGRGDLEAVGPVALEHAAESLGLPRAGQLVAHGEAGIATAHHDGADHLDGGAQGPADDAGDGPGEHELGRHGGGGGLGGQEGRDGVRQAGEGADGRDGAEGHLEGVAGRPVPAAGNLGRGIVIVGRFPVGRQCRGGLFQPNSTVVHSSVRSDGGIAIHRSALRGHLRSN